MVAALKDGAGAARRRRSPRHCRSGSTPCRRSCGSPCRRSGLAHSGPLFSPCCARSLKHAAARAELRRHPWRQRPATVVPAPSWRSVARHSCNLRAMHVSAKYDASDIEVLSGLDPVRRRPGMYTDTSRPNHLAHEVIDNSVDEALAGHCSASRSRCIADGSLEVADDGRGMPVDIHPQEKIPGVELILTRLHSGAQVLEQQLPVLRRPARRRRVGRERPVEEPRGLGPARRPGVQHELSRRQSREQARGGRQGRQGQHRHHAALLARPEVLRFRQVLGTAAEARAAGEGRALSGPEDPLRGREAEAVFRVGVPRRAGPVPHRVRGRCRHAAGPALHRRGQRRARGSAVGPVLGDR